MNTSSSDRQSYKCDLCHFDSAYANSLKTHMRTHTKEKALKCKVCDYASVQATNLKTHVKIHKGEKAYKCNQCDFASSRAYCLKTHSKTHGGENTQMQPLRLCICLCRQFEKTYEDSH